MTTVSETISSTQAELEKLVGDLRGLLASKDLDGIPEIKQLRQRLDDGIHSVRDSAVRAAQEAALQAKDAARAADRYATMSLARCRRCAGRRGAGGLHAGPPLTGSAMAGRIVNAAARSSAWEGLA